MKLEKVNLVGRTAMFFQPGINTENEELKYRT